MTNWTNYVCLKFFVTFESSSERRRKKPQPSGNGFQVPLPKGLRP